MGGRKSLELCLSAAPCYQRPLPYSAAPTSNGSLLVSLHPLNSEFLNKRNSILAKFATSFYTTATYFFFFLND